VTVAAHETVWLEECEDTTTFTGTPAAYLETEPTETPTTSSHSTYNVRVKCADFENMTI
jgi:hypothetical protein